jgi:thymidylate kinase
MPNSNESEYTPEVEKFDVPYIILDGPSGTGKSTTLSLIQSTLPVFFIEEEGNLDKKLQIQFNDHVHETEDQLGKADLLVRYRTLILGQLRERGIEKKYSGMILARGESTTIAYQGEGDLRTMNDIYELHRQNDSPKPDAVVIITADPETVEERIHQREEPAEGFSGKFTTSKNRERIHDSYDLLEGFLKSKDINVLKIDTRAKSPYYVADCVLQFLEDNNYIDKKTYEKGSSKLHTLYTLEGKTSQLAIEKFLRGGRKFDIIHTQYGLETLKQMRESIPFNIYKLLCISFAFHDIGYSLMEGIDDSSYDSILGSFAKLDHAVLGAKKTKEMLDTYSYEYSSLFSKEEKSLIYNLVLYHDKVEDVVNLKYKGFELGRFLMSLDTIGAYTAIAKGQATFTKDELIQYLKKNDIRRGKQIHPLLKALFEKTREEINNNFDKYYK